MKKTLLLLPALVVCSFSAHAKLNVVSTLPDFGWLAREIGGDKVNVTILAKPTEDPHFVDARPSFVVSMRNADVLIDGGAELELGWLPPLLQNARNPKIEIGKPGRVQASQGMRLMNVPANVTRAAGDVHALGTRTSRLTRSLPKRLRSISRNRFPRSIRRMRHFMKRTTRNSKQRLTQSCRNGAPRCYRSKASTLSPITIRGHTLRIASV